MLACAVSLLTTHPRTDSQAFPPLQDAVYTIASDARLLLSAPPAPYLYDRSTANPLDLSFTPSLTWFKYGDLLSHLPRDLHRVTLKRYGLCTRVGLSGSQDTMERNTPVHVITATPSREVRPVSGVRGVDRAEGGS